ncbi:TetR/AcrR family transcriptional regulator [Staphylococcus saprophyticus]|nr:TetR/AcrR family transcriptional regulator [Staphylococcus saprophyticus]
MNKYLKMLMLKVVKMVKRKEKSQQLIISSFVELIREKDFDKVSMNDIAQHANINRGTIYLNFIDKYDILDHAIDFYFECSSKSMQSLHGKIRG